MGSDLMVYLHMKTILRQAKIRLAEELPGLHRLLRGVLPSRPLPFSVRGGCIYLDLKDSHKALARIFGLYEPDKMYAISKLLTPGMVFVDVGAAKGDFTLMAAELVGPTGCVLAFEPHPNNCAWLRRSIQRSGYTTVSVHQIAIGRSDGNGLLYLSSRSEWHSILPGQRDRDKGTLEISIRTLDSFLLDLGCRQVDIIKIDAEGAELEILQGSLNTIIENPSLVLVMDLHPGMSTNPQEVVDWLCAHGFEVFCISAPYLHLEFASSSLREVIATRDSGRIRRLGSRNERR
jgi:FkbM family methyltransferase